MKILYYVQYANCPKMCLKFCAKSQQKKLDKLEQVCYNIIKIRGADKPTKQKKEFIYGTKNNDSSINKW